MYVCLYAITREREKQMSPNFQGSSRVPQKIGGDLGYGPKMTFFVFCCTGW